MRWLQTEYVLKGIFLGLLAFLALRAPNLEAMGRAGLYVLGGLALALVVAAVPKWRQGYKVRGRVLSFVLFLLLESSLLVYAGILLGTTLGAMEIVTGHRPSEDAPSESIQGDFLTALLGGAALGLVFGALRSLKDRRARLGLSLGLGALLVTGALCLFGEIKIPGYNPEHLLHPVSRLVFGAVLLLGMPVFYLLTFAGTEEESEIEIAVACAAVGLGTWVMIQDESMHSVRSLIRPLAFVVPVMFFFGYTMRIMPGLKVFKHTLRGISHARIGRYPQALRAYRRALTLDPNSELAREGYWAVHRDLDLGLLADDPETLSLVDFDLCLERAGLLLMKPPTLAKLDEANRLLGLVANQRPDMKPIVDYWSSVAHTHCRRHDQASADLERLIDPATYGKDDPRRQSIVLRAWQLALMGPEELRRRVGAPQIAQPGRRLEAIAAVEHRLAEAADDGPAWALKRLLYQDLSAAEFEQAAGNLPATDFDYSYVQQLGLALINDPGRWQRGGDYLRMAAHGMPALGPSIFVQIAQASQSNGNIQGAWDNYELAKRAGRAVGPKSLAEPERQAYFAVVKMLGEATQAKGDHAAAIENFHLYTESERSGLETLRTLAALYEAKGDPLAAAHITEQALVYNAKDKDLLARKDKYYYSVLHDDLRAKLEQTRQWFDVSYCFKKAKALLDPRFTDLEYLDWAQHLVELGRIIQPESLTAKVLLARALLRRGEKEEAVALLESVRTPKPERFTGEDDEDSWYLANRLLGELYLYDLGRADLAVNCFNDFRHSAKSGADTMFKLGQAYEQVGDRERAVKCYKQVTGYDGHPLAPDAHDALQRLQTS
jgi:tetratricopeptide (TPR) repeat protein